MKAGGCNEPSSCIVFQCLVIPMKHEPQVSEIASQSRIKIPEYNRVIIFSL